MHNSAMWLTPVLAVFVLMSCTTEVEDAMWDGEFTVQAAGIDEMNIPYDGAESLGVVLLTDLVTKDKVELEGFGDWTRIVNLDTLEYVDVEGDWTDSFDDESYTEMMEEKRAAAEQQADTPSYALSGSGNFSITNSWTTPEYYKSGSNAVRTTMNNITTYNPNDHSLRIELKRSISFWFDTSYGTKEYWITSSGGGGNKTWSSATSSGDYYLIISIPTYTGYWTTGSYSLYD